MPESKSNSRGLGPETLQQRLGPRAESGMKMDQELAQQLRKLMDFDAAGGSPSLRRALVEATLWTVGSIGVWILTLYFA